MSRQGERGPQGDHGQTGDTGARGERGERGLPPRFDWTHLVAYLLLAGAFTWSAKENRDQGQLIGAQQSRTQRCVDDLRSDLRGVLRAQIDLRSTSPMPTPEQVVESLKQQIVRLEDTPC